VKKPLNSLPHWRSQSHCKVAGLSQWLCESAFWMSEADKPPGDFWWLGLRLESSCWCSCATAVRQVAVCTGLLIWLCTRVNWHLHFPGHNEPGQEEFSECSQCWSLDAGHIISWLKMVGLRWLHGNQHPKLWLTGHQCDQNLSVSDQISRTGCQWATHLFVCQPFNLKEKRHYLWMKDMIYLSRYNKSKTHDSSMTNWIAMFNSAASLF